MKRTIYIIFLFVITLLQGGCAENENPSNFRTIEKPDVCNCNDVFLDPEFGHFYTDKRDEPFTGLCESYYSDGSVMAMKNYLEGRLDGKYLEYYENGAVKSEWNFLKGRQHGDYKGYYPDGNLIYHSIFYKGDQDSVVFPPSQ